MLELAFLSSDLRCVKNASQVFVQSPIALLIMMLALSVCVATCAQASRPQSTAIAAIAVRGSRRVAMMSFVLVAYRTILQTQAVLGFDNPPLFIARIPLIGSYLYSIEFDCC